MRPINLGRKNALFAGSAAGGRDWAILASLLTSAKLNVSPRSPTSLTLPPHRDGGLDPMFWSTGFLVAIRLAPRAWNSATNPDNPVSAPFQALNPFLFGTAAIAETDVPAMAKAILDFHEYFKLRRRKSMR